METADRFTAALAEQTQRDNNQFTPPNSNSSNVLVVENFYQLTNFIVQNMVNMESRGNAKSASARKRENLYSKRLA
jgi:hypothetical protein